MRNALITSVVLALVLLGCSDNPSPSESPAPPTEGPGVSQPVPGPDVSESATESAGDFELVAGDERGYVGSGACKRCHEPEYYFWMRTPHSYMTKTLETERLIDDSPVHAPDFVYDEDEVSLVLGNIKKNVFLREEDGIHHFLPQQYNLANETWEPFNLNEWEPQIAAADEGQERTWNSSCAGCHTTGYDPTRGTFVELSVACEECHGPGAAHARSEKRDDIVNPAALHPELAASICAQCHARGVCKEDGRPFSWKFQPGEDIHLRMDLFVPQAGTNTDLFWGNGMARRHHQQFQEFIQSRHFTMGLSCLDCHRGHRLKLRKPPSVLRGVMMTVERRFLAARAYSVCVRCHIRGEDSPIAAGKSTLFDTPEGHTHHPDSVRKPLGPGGELSERPIKMLCNDCHMPKTAPTEFSFEMHSHTFRVPVPLATIRYGVPDACSGCHEEEDEAWVTRQIRTLWLTPGLIRLHLVRYSGEAAELQAGRERIRAFVADAPEDRRELGAGIDAQLAAVEAVASTARDAIGAIDRAPETVSDAIFSAYQQVRSTEPELYRLTNVLRAREAELRAEVRKVVNRDALDALNHVRLVQGKAALEVSGGGASWRQAEEALLTLNKEVESEGQAWFEGQGRKTTWEDWVRIYLDLKDGQLEEQHAVFLKELADLGLVRHGTRLR